MVEEGAGAIARLIQEFGKLPGIGPKTAERLTHYLLGAGRADGLAVGNGKESGAVAPRHVAGDDPTRADSDVIGMGTNANDMKRFDWLA